MPAGAQSDASEKGEKVKVEKSASSMNSKKRDTKDKR